MELSGLTILSIPLGPRDVLTTSATAIDRAEISWKLMGKEREQLTFGSDNVGLTDIFGLFRAKGGSLIATCGSFKVLRHLNF